MGGTSQALEILCTCLDNRVWLAQPGFLAMGAQQKALLLNIPPPVVQKWRMALQHLSLMTTCLF